VQEASRISAPAQAPPAGRRLRLALLVIAAAQLMLVLDATIVNVALPSIQRALRMRTSDLTWVLTSYGLAFGGLLLAGGRAGELFGRRRVFRLGLVVFTLASLVGGALGLAILAAVATGATSNQPPGTALPDALTHAYTTGILAGGVPYPAALAVAALTLSPGAAQQVVAPTSAQQQR
jgi:MFS family permease